MSRVDFSRAVKTARTNTAEDSYMDLIREFPLRHIHTRSQYLAAAAVLDRLALRDDLESGERDYLEALEDLIDAYDDANTSLLSDSTTPVERLREMMQQAGLNARDLARLLGVTDALVSMVLSGKRQISKSQAKKLAQRFKVDVACFI